MRHLVNVVILCGFIALVGCGDNSEKREDIAPVKPTVVGGDFAISNLAYQLAGDDLEVVYPVPNGIEPKDWRDTQKQAALEAGLEKLGENSIILVSDGDLEIQWFSRLVSQSLQVQKFSHQTGALNPPNAAALIDDISKALKEIAPSAASRIEARRLALHNKKLNRLVERWKKLSAETLKPKVLCIDPDIAEYAKTAPMELIITDPKSIADAAQNKGAKHLLAYQKPSPEFASLLSKRQITTVLIDRGRKRAASTNDILTTIEGNLKKIETLIETAEPEIEKASLDHFEGRIVPIIEQYCIDCHDSDNEEGGVNFENFLTTKEAERNPDFWDRVAAQLDLGTMPPKKKKNQPSATEVAAFEGWISQLSNRWDRAEFGRDPGRTTLRRLNKNEYNYTVRDLFGLKIRPGAHFPEDGGGEAGFDNNADGLFLGSLLMENYIEAAGVVAQAVFANPTTRRKFVMSRPGPNLPEAKAARNVFSYWASICYRRPAKKSEIENLLRIFKSQRKKKKSYDSAMQMTLVAMLISPEFLYRAEVKTTQKKPYQINQFDLANRLSYFLWSSMPDRELFTLAKSGKLSQPKVIEAQVLRMLKDKRSLALSMHFAGQWFGWEMLRSEANPDEKRFPQFTMPLRVAMYQESTEFFKHLIETNSSIYDLIDCNYAFLNEPLARHYGIPGVKGNALRKVLITNRNRGGVLGMGSVLVATSLPLRSSPAKRGDYVLSEILGTPPPEPPMNVEQLPEDDKGVARTFREALEQHREDPSCISCHESIDPIGFGMENFDAIGRWRTHQNKAPIDATGVMPDGSKVTSPADLKQILLKDKEMFARTLVKKLLSYALGRELTPYDRPVIAELTRKVVADNGRIGTAFVEVAKSYPFRHRRNEGYRPTKSQSNQKP